MKTIALALVACVVAGCAEVRLKEDVVGSEGRWFNSWLISNDVLSYGALNDLRNHAHQKGADTVFVPGITNLFRTSVTVIGQAYKCQ